jgi:hypothetical protein
VSRRLGPDDQATLLAWARVAAWSTHALPGIADMRELEDTIRAAARTDGIDPAAPMPIRIEGRFTAIDIHVLDRSCPIAHPDGPPPWRLRGARAEGVLVGVYAEGQGGVLTHHSQRSHLHAILRLPDGSRVSGHLDSVQIEPGARLQIPRRIGRAPRSPR